jgi:hypothetical protein
MVCRAGKESQVGWGFLLIMSLLSVNSPPTKEKLRKSGTPELGRGGCGFVWEWITFHTCSWGFSNAIQNIASHHSSRLGLQGELPGDWPHTTQRAENQEMKVGNKLSRNLLWARALPTLTYHVDAASEATANGDNPDPTRAEDKDHVNARVYNNPVFAKGSTGEAQGGRRGSPGSSEIGICVTWGSPSSNLLVCAMGKH